MSIMPWFPIAERTYKTCLMNGAIIIIHIHDCICSLHLLYLQCCFTMSVFIQGLSQVVPGCSFWVLWFLENIILPINPGTHQIFSILSNTMVIKMVLESRVSQSQLTEKVFELLFVQATFQDGLCRTKISVYVCRNGYE